MQILMQQLEERTLAFISIRGSVAAPGSRLFVQDSIHDAFVEKIVSMSKARRVGNPFDAQTEQGPQIDKVQFDKIMSFIDSDGLRERPAPRRQASWKPGIFIEPTIFTNVQDEMTIAREEIFGPVLSVLRFGDTEELVQRANATPFGLAAAVWTRDIARAHDVARRIRAGTVWINCYDVFDAAAPVWRL